MKIFADFAVNKAETIYLQDCVSDCLTVSKNGLIAPVWVKEPKDGANEMAIDHFHHTMQIGRRNS